MLLNNDNRLLPEDDGQHDRDRQDRLVVEMRQEGERNSAGSHLITTQECHSNRLSIAPPTVVKSVCCDKPVGTPVSP